MLLIRAEWAYITRRVMDKAMAFHFVFALEALAAFGARTAFYWAVVWTVLRVYICVGAVVKVLARPASRPLPLPFCFKFNENYIFRHVRT